jgi:hypothetical protein
MKFFQKLTPLLLCSMVAGAGCGGKYFRPYAHSEAAITMVARCQDGLVVKVDPLLDSHACKTNFGVDCHQKGILPVYLMVTNGNPEISYRIIANEICFVDGGAQTLKTKSGLVETNTDAAGSGLAIAGGVVAGLSAVSGIAIIGFAMKATDDAESIRENFVIKQFQNVTLNPGRTAEGFVYYGQSSPILLNALPIINIPAHNLKTRETNNFLLPLTNPL